MPYLHPVYFLDIEKKLAISSKKQDRELNSCSF